MRMKLHETAKMKNITAAVIDVSFMVPNLNLFNIIVKQVSNAAVMDLKSSKLGCKIMKKSCTNAKNIKKKMARKPDKSSQQALMVRIKRLNLKTKINELNDELFCLFPEHFK